MNDRNFEFLDAVNIVSFMAQLKNMEEDDKQTEYVRIVIQSIFREIEKLHEENDRIISLLEKIQQKVE